MIHENKSLWQRITATVLAVILAVGMTPAIIASETTPFRLVTIGASNVNGFGLRGYLKAPEGSGLDDDSVMEAAALSQIIKGGANVLGYGQMPAKSYPSYLKEALEERLDRKVDVSQLAISSMRAEELRILLDNDYYGDAYSAWRFIGKGKWFDVADGKEDDDFSQLRSEYQTAVKNADLVTVDIGVNNFGVYISYMLTSGFALDNDLALVDPEIADLYETAKPLVTDLLANAGIDAGDYTDLLDTLAYALVGFCHNFDKSIGKIYELNPDATVVVVSIQNLLTGLSAKLGDTELPLGDWMGVLINAANAYMAIGSPYASKYLCADVRENGRVEFFIDKMAAYDGDPTHLDKEIIDCFNVWDGNPNDDYSKGLHIKYMLGGYLIGKQIGLVTITAENVDAFFETQLGTRVLNAAYDAFAQILSAGANVKTFDLAALSLDGKTTDGIQNALIAGIQNALISSVTGALLGRTFTLSDTFFSDIAAASGVPTSVVETVAAMAVRMDIGNSFFAHPTPDGHKEVADAILGSLENGTTGADLMGGIAVTTLGNLFDAYGPAILEVYETFLDSVGCADMEEFVDLIMPYIEDSPMAMIFLLYTSFVISIVSESSPEDMEGELLDLVDSAKVLLKMIEREARHGFYQNADGELLVVLGGDTAVARNIDRDDDAFYDIVKAYYGLSTVKNLGQSKLMPWELYDYVIANAATIADADFITFEIDASSFLYGALYGEADWTQYVSADVMELIASVVPAIREALTGNPGGLIPLDPNAFAAKVSAKLTAVITDALAAAGSDEPLDAETLGILLDVTENFLYASVSGVVNSLKATAAIREINPDAPVAVLGLYNPLKGFTVRSGDDEIDLGAFVDVVIAVTDVLYTSLAIRNGFTFVPVADTATDDFDGALDLDTLDLSSLVLTLLNMDDKMVANAEGHAYIAEQIIGAIRKDTACEHVYDDEHDLICNECGYTRVIVGDLNSDGYVTKDDAVQLLYSAQFPDDPDYALNQDADFDGDSRVTHKDAIYLLYHTFYGDKDYPLVQAEPTD